MLSLYLSSLYTSQSRSWGSWELFTTYWPYGASRWWPSRSIWRENDDSSM